MRRGCLLHFVSYLALLRPEYSGCYYDLNSNLPENFLSIIFPYFNHDVIILFALGRSDCVLFVVWFTAKDSSIEVN